MSATLVSAFILISSGVLLLLWLRSACQSVLGSQFERDYSSEVAEANQLEFLAVRHALENSVEEHPDVGEAVTALERDYEALTYLLRNAATVHVGRYSQAERLLILDFQLLRLWVRASHLVGLRTWRSALLEMAAILQYFGNVVGQRLVTFPAAATTP